MNKVIGEFLSNQQPYPQFMATVVYKVRPGAQGGRAYKVRGGAQGRAGHPRLSPLTGLETWTSLATWTC